MKVMIVSTSEIARCGGVLDARYYLERLSPDETVTEWKTRVAVEKRVAHVQEHLRRLGGVECIDPKCQKCQGSGVYWNGKELVRCNVCNGG